MEDLQAAIAAYLRAQRRRRLASSQHRPESQPGEGRAVAIYARVATMTQTDRLALETQVAAGLAYAEHHRLQQPTVYREVMGGDTLERPRLAELRAAIAQGRIGTVLVTDPDRLTSDPALFETLRAECAAHDVAIIVVRGA